ncbi:MAG TPA: hypothetical protein VJ949_04275 [Cryomorphaceae bacterium]|nr:hypothetical protein [Cryomorphaceae bacterium]
MKRAMTTLCCLLIIFYYQAQDSLMVDSVLRVGYEDENLRFGSEGFVDFSTIGAWNTSAQLMRFWIGEPEVFRIPLLIFAGATNIPFSTEEVNATTIYDLVNPVGGNISLAFDYHSKPFFRSKSGITSLHWNLFGAGKLIRGQSMEFETGKTDLGYFVEAGITFQTAAGDKESIKSSDHGTAFFSIRYVLTELDSNTMETFFGSRIKPQGIRLEAGVLVKDRINMRLSYFEATRGTELPTLDKAQWRFGVDYRLVR